MKFELGELVTTASVADCINERDDFTQFVRESMERYNACDWGDLCDEDAAQNNDAVSSGEGRILASYPYAANPDLKIWIITEWDRSATTILFPHEY